MANVKIGIDIDAKINNSINSQIDALEKKFNEVQTAANKGGFGDKIKADVQSAKAEISGLREEFNSVYASFKSQKLDTKAFDDFVKSVQSSISEMDKKILDVQENMKKLEIAFKGGQNSTLFEKKLASMQSQIDSFVKQTQDGITVLTEFNKLVNQGSDIKIKGDTSELKDKVSQEVSSFSFKDGGVKVPVTLDSASYSKIKDQYNAIVSKLQAYAETNPVDVTMRLFPLNSTKTSTKEVSDAIKNIQTQVASLPEGELKDSISSLYGNLEKEYQKALKLKVSVDFGDTQKSVKARIADLKREIEKEVTVYPKFEISETESTKIKNLISQIQEDVTLGTSSKIQTMADSFKKVLTTSDVKKWSDEFVAGLDLIQDKLNQVVPLMNQLRGTTSTKNNKNTYKDSVPTESDVNVLVEFTTAMQSLRESLQAQQNSKLSIDVTPLIEKLDTVKATVSMVHTGIGHLQATLSNVNNTGGLQVISETLQRIETIINEINTEGSGINLKVNPDVDVQNFINEIQSQISQSAGVKIPITLLESSIDSFINQVHLAIDSRLTNGDIGSDYLVPTQDNDLGAKNITSVNTRIGNLQTKIDSTWDSWYQFAQAAISGTDLAKEGVIGVINKLEELSWALQSVSSQFVGLDFTKQIGDLNVLKDIVNINTSATSSATSISAEANAMAEVYNKALQAAEAKVKFSDANKEVLQSIISSLSALNSEGKGFENLNKLIKNLANNKDDRITDMVANLELLRDVLSSSVDENSFAKALENIGNQGDKLKDLATLLKANKEQLNNVSNVLNVKESTNVEKAIEQYNRLYNAQIELSKIKPGTNDVKYLYYTQELNEARLAIDNIKLSEEERGIVEEQTSAKSIAAANAEAEAKRKLEIENQKNIESAENLKNSIIKQAATMSTNGKLMAEYGERVHEISAETKSLNTSVNPSDAIGKLKELKSELDNISVSAKEAGKSGKSFGQILSSRFQSLSAYLGTFVSFYRIVSYVREAITTLVDLDTQLVDLKKTTSMTTGELNEFYNASSNVAKQLGVTTSEIISQASAWSRLGYSSKEAATQMAELSSQFTSISPGMTTDESTDYLVSTMQAYGIVVDDVERKIMDNVNRIGKILPKHMVTYGVKLLT